MERFRPTLSAVAFLAGATRSNHVTSISSSGRDIFDLVLSPPHKVSHTINDRFVRRGRVLAIEVTQFALGEARIKLDFGSTF